jgi:hypothetical protein
VETTAGGAVVSDEPWRAAELVAAGRDVVLIVSPDGGDAPRLSALAAGAGRLALLVGRPGDPEVRQAARAMADELFGPRSSSGPST